MSQTALSEDNILLLAPILGGFATYFGQGHTVFGLNPFILSVAVAAIAKALPSLSNLKSWEDWLLLASTVLGVLYGAFSANPDYATYGIIAGFLLKALASLKDGLNLEDILLALSVVAAGFGQVYGLTDLANVGLLFGTLGKSLSPPSAGSKPPTPV